MKRGFKKVYTGIDIGRTMITSAQVGWGGDGWYLISLGKKDLPEEVIRFSYKNDNILQKDALADALGELLHMDENPGLTVGVALPNEIVKVAIQSFAELPQSGADIERMVAWTIEKNLHFQAQSTKVSYDRIGWKNGVERMLVCAGTFSVIREYELLMKAINIRPRIINPQGIAQFNFYSNQLPDKGVVAYLGLFEGFFTLFVFIEGNLAFYQGIRKGFSDTHYLDDIDMCFEFYLNENPDNEIQRLFIGGCLENKKDMQGAFSALGNMDVRVMNELASIRRGSAIGSGKMDDLAVYASAIGAAQSLLA